MPANVSLLLLVVICLFSCKKDDAPTSETTVTGSWALVVQLQTAATWPAVNIDSVKVSCNPNYILNSNHTGTYTRIILPGNSTQPTDIISKWVPGLLLGSLPAMPPVIYKTTPCFWTYNSREKRLVILNSQRQQTEAWDFEVMEPGYLVTPAATVNITGSTNIQRRARIMFIKK
ncbi:hypothetical protein [Chitinophaga sp. 30R24]|uniref:hypothetical protein n=1 Tax=Chitinophaga sp. 30R24 TaxID=3248838 RepID=UPI003B983220